MKRGGGDARRTQRGDILLEAQVFDTYLDHSTLSSLARALHNETMRQVAR